MARWLFSQLLAAPDDGTKFYLTSSITSDICLRSVSSSQLSKEVFPGSDGLPTPHPEPRDDPNEENGHIFDKKNLEDWPFDIGLLAVWKPARRLPLILEERLTADVLLPELCPVGQVRLLVEVAGNQDHVGKSVQQGEDACKGSKYI